MLSTAKFIITSLLFVCPVTSLLAFAAFAGHRNAFIVSQAVTLQ